YKNVHEAWQDAFDNRGYTESTKKKVTDCLRTARNAESKALLMLEKNAIAPPTKSRLINSARKPFSFQPE
ncbi:MAG: hypothetical protein II282_07755, partial [Alistipes sp.]|nr:hypothetical protein [Alistipes sp.]